MKQIMTNKSYFDIWLDFSLACYACHKCFFFVLALVFSIDFVLNLAFEWCYHHEHLVHAWEFQLLDQQLQIFPLDHHHCEMNITSLINKTGLLHNTIFSYMVCHTCDVKLLPFVIYACSDLIPVLTIGNVRSTRNR